MIIRPYFQKGPYISSGQISKLIVQLTYIHVQRLSKPHIYYDKFVSHTFASLHKIHMNMWTNMNETSDKYTQTLKQIHRNIMTTLNDTSDKKHEDDSKSSYI